MSGKMPLSNLVIMAVIFFGVNLRLANRIQQGPRGSEMPRITNGYF